MRKWTALLALLLIPVASWAQDRALRVHVSPIHGQLDMLLSICDQLDGDAALRNLLQEDATYRKRSHPAIDAFCKLDFEQGGREYSNGPSGYAGWFSPWQQMQGAAVISADLADFTDRSVGLFSLEDQATVRQALREIAPYYQRLVSAPYASQIAAMRTETETYLHERHVDALMAKLTRLYAIDWPADLPLHVGLSPLPPKNGFTATVAGNVVRSYMPLNFRELDTYTAVILHEFAHVLFANQSLTQVDVLRKAFADVPSRNRRYAEAWLNEALATAAGNGWVFHQLTGKDDSTQWYDNPIIDAYAHAIAPRVYQALDDGRALDASDVAEFVAAFDRALPNARRDPDMLLPFAALRVEGAGESTRVLTSIYRRKAGTRRLIASDTSEPDDAFMTSALTLLDVAIDPKMRDAPTWRRETLPDGRFRFSATVRDASAFDVAMDDLIARIRADRWE